MMLLRTVSSPITFSCCYQKDIDSVLFLLLIAIFWRVLSSITRLSFLYDRWHTRLHIWDDCFLFELSIDECVCVCVTGEHSSIREISVDKNSLTTLLYPDRWSSDRNQPVYWLSTNHRRESISLKKQMQLAVIRRKLLFEGKKRLHINDGRHVVHFVRFAVACLPFSVASLTHVPDDKPAPIYNA